MVCTGQSGGQQKAFQTKTGLSNAMKVELFPFPKVYVKVIQGKKQKTKSVFYFQVCRVAVKKQLMSQRQGVVRVFIFHLAFVALFRDDVRQMRAYSVVCIACHISKLRTIKFPSSNDVQTLIFLCVFMHVHMFLHKFSLFA